MKIDFESISFKYLLFSFDGRIGRSSYWIGTLIFFVPQLIGGLLLDQVQPLFQFFGLIICLACLWPIYAIKVKRWHDLNKPWFWCFIELIPVIGPIWAFIDLGFRVGTTGPNQFGVDPLGEEGDYDLLPRFNDLVSMFYWMCRTDDSMPSEKIAVVDDFFRQALAFDTPRRKRAMQHFHQAGGSVRDFAYHARCFSNIHWENSGLLKDTLHGLFYIAVTDGKITSQERSFIDQAGEIFKMECDEYISYCANQPRS